MGTKMWYFGISVNRIEINWFELNLYASGGNGVDILQTQHLFSNIVKVADNLL